MAQQSFWKHKTLAEMTRVEWESLCDGCAKCCLVQLEDEDGERDFTDIACRLLNCETGRCRDYSHRSVRVPSCVTLTADNIADLHFMPKTCAYRLVSEGKDLPVWHPLVSGDPDSTAKAGMAVKGQVTSEKHVSEDELELRIRDWPGE
tara:strand:+ start:358 stop:801 length:444 start_codon:yes stop_codon:yes gene_type:complete